MRAYKMILICVLATLSWAGAFGVRAQEESPWQPAPLTAIDPAPWRSAGSAWTASAASEEPEFLEMRVADDTFIANRYPFDWRAFGNEQSVWFGRDPDLGWLWALLRFDRPTLPAGARYLGAAIYLPIAGQEPVAELPVTAHAILSPWDGGTVKWQERPYVNPYPLASFTIGRELGWYWFDLSDAVRRWYNDWDSLSYGIALRSPESPGNVVKGMFSREAGDDKPVATLVVAYLPDRTPPTCAIQPLSPISSAPVIISFSCWDEGSGVAMAEIQFRQQDGDWQTALQTIPGPELSSVQVAGVRGGKTYSFRLRANDRAGNFSPWTSDGAAVTSIEATPPTLTVSGVLPAWLRAGAFPALQLSAQDPGPISSDPVEIEFASYHLATGVTQLTRDWGELTLLPGQRYALKARSVDRAHNTSPWIPLGTTTIYARLASGTVTDPQGQPMSGVALRSQPAAINQPTTDINGRFALYRADFGAFRVESAVPASVQVQQAAVASANDDVTGLSLRAGLRQQSIVNGDFNASLASGWQSRTGRAALQPLLFNDANRVLRFGAPPAMTLDGQTMQSEYLGCMAAGPDGTLHIVTTYSLEPYSFERTIYYLARRPGNLAWDAPQSLGEFQEGAIIYPGRSCLLSAAADGGVGLVYRLRKEDNWVAPVFRYRPPGGEWGPIEWLPPDHELALAMGPGGAAHVLVGDTYHGQIEEYQLRYYYREPSGAWRTPVPITPFSTGDAYAAILVSPDNTRHVLWTAMYSPDGNLKYVNSRDGQNWSQPQALVAPDGMLILDNPILRLSPTQGLHAFWLQFHSSTEQRLVFYARYMGGRWEAPRPLPLPAGITRVAAFAADVDPAGRWHILLSPDYSYPYDEVTDFLLSGADLAHLVTSARLRMSSERRTQRILVTDSVDTHLLRHVDPNYPGVFNPTPILVSVPHEPLETASSVSQSVTIPTDLFRPTLAWRAGNGHNDVDSNGGELRVSLTDRNGATRELSVMDGVGVSETEWFDVAPWAGQQITLTFRFHPRGDRSAWAWVDDVYLGAVPLNAGVSLARNNWPEAGQPFTFTLTVANRRPYPLNIPVELTWPADWPLRACTASGAVSTGVARFEIPMDGMAEEPITCAVDIPPETERIGKTISAAIGQPIAGQDYTPADNRATLTVIVDGRPTWLPVIAR